MSITTATDPLLQLARQYKPHPAAWSPAPWMAHTAGSVVLGSFERTDGTRHPLRAFVTLRQEEETGSYWLHLVLSHRKRVPTLAELSGTCEELGYAGLTWVQVVPPRAPSAVKQVVYCLHAFARIGVDVVPRSLAGGVEAI